MARMMGYSVTFLKSPAGRKTSQVMSPGSHVSEVIDIPEVAIKFSTRMGSERSCFVT